MNSLPMDGYAAIVDQRVITIGDVMVSIHEAFGRLQTRYGGDELEEKRRELFMSGLERMIDQALIIEEFKTMEGQIPDRAIDDRINDITFNEFNNDRAELLAALAKDGITLEEWRETIRERIIVSAMRRNAIGDRVIISPLQIREAYEKDQDRFQQPEQVRLNLIFVKHDGDSDKAFARVTKLREEITSGTPFADVAKESSDDWSASVGGDWGWVKPSELREELKTAVSNLTLNAVSEPVMTPEGYYLLQMSERKEGRTRSLEEVREEIETELKEQEIERLNKEWMERLRAKHSVLYYIPSPPQKS